MKKQKQMRDAFGIDEFGHVDLPVKISNVQVSRISTAMNGVVPGVFRTDLKPATQQLTTVSEIGNAFGNRNGKRSRGMVRKRKSRNAPAFFFWAYCVDRV